MDAEDLLIDLILDCYSYHVYRNGIVNHGKVALISLSVFRKIANFILLTAANDSVAKEHRDRYHKA